ncbi:hypothetical protein SAMN04487917_11531 [Arthrobacter sp. yr096]|nr:hypothetical protein SAMN04487917_11531 [Arthrobacter sp. yr096]
MMSGATQMRVPRILHLYAGVNPTFNTEPSGLKYGDGGESNGCDPFSTPGCAGVDDVPYPQNTGSNPCAFGLFMAGVGPMLPGPGGLPP